MARGEVADPAAADLSPVLVAEPDDLRVSLTSIVHWADSTPVRREVMQAVAFPHDDMGMFLVVNQLTYNGAMRPAELVQVLGATPTNMSKIVGRLVEAGLVVRVAAPDDDRGVLVALTSAGREIGVRIADRASASLAETLAGWSEPDVAALRRLLGRLALRGQGRSACHAERRRTDGGPMSKKHAISAEVSADALAAVSTPAKVETPLGEFEFFDGMPLPDTVTKAWDTLDLIRAVEVFLNAMPGASMVAMRNGFRSIGSDANHKLIYTDPRADSAQIVLTANTVTAYGTNYIDLSEGPVVVEVPPNSLSFVDDIWQRYVSDMGNAGEDRGAGGKYLFLPPGYDGDVPDGYFVRQSPTYSNWLVIRALGGVADLVTTRIYALAAADSPPEMEFINMAAASFIGVHANDLSFYDEIDTIVQAEPIGCLDPERAGQIAALGIVKGRPFEPDERMRGILDAGAHIGGAIARSLTYKPRDRSVYYYPDGSWKSPLLGGSYDFLRDGTRLLDARALMQYVATGVTPAMSIAGVGIGSQYAYTAEDSTGEWLDGGNHYTLRLPAGIPAKTFWSIDIYDPQTRSLLQTSNPWPSINSFYGEVPTEADGDTIIHFSPEPGDGQDNWLQTVPGKGWFAMLRLYGPLEPWFDQTWRPGEIQRVD